MICNEAITFCLLHGSTDSHAIRHAALSVDYSMTILYRAATTLIDMKRVVVFKKMLTRSLLWGGINCQ